MKNAMHFLPFNDVHGYSTYERAKRRGEELDSDHPTRWVVIALPNGRFTPMVIANDGAEVSYFIHQRNVCIAN